MSNNESFRWKNRYIYFLFAEQGLPEKLTIVDNYFQSGLFVGKKN